MELYLKSYSQSKFWSNLLFKLKQKRKRFGGEYAFGAGETYWGITPSLNPTWTGTGSLTVGPEGPLVRFDQSIPPSSSSARMEARQRRSPPANGGSPRVPEGLDGSARLRRSFRWSLGRRGWKESSAVSFAAEGGFGAKWLRGGGGSRSKWSRGKVYGRMRGFLVERTKSGRPWWCRIGRGSGGGCRCRRWG